MKNYLDKLIRYGRWADRTLLERLVDGTAPADALRLFEHLVAAQELWLARVQSARTDIDIWAEPNPATWQERLDRVQSQWTAAIRNATNPDSVVDYHNTRGEPYSTSFRDIVTHISIHGQHHRAQIALLLRRAGIAPPPLDYIVFVRHEAAAS